MYQKRKAAACGVLVLALAACGDEPRGPTGPTGEEVAGIYSVCALTFDPEGDLLTEVDVLDRGIETDEDSGVRAPQLQVDASRQFQLLFTPEGQFVERNLSGTYTPAGTRVRLTFSAGTAQAASFLLPGTLELAFQATPKSLTTAATTVYDVARADYARLAGVSESGLADRIPGRLMAVFQSPGCN